MLVYVCHFASDYNCMMALPQYLNRKWQIKSSLTIKADFIIRVPASASERPYLTKAVGDEVIVSRGQTAVFVQGLDEQAFLLEANASSRKWWSRREAELALKKWRHQYNEY